MYKLNIKYILKKLNREFKQMSKDLNYAVSDKLNDILIQVKKDIQHRTEMGHDFEGKDFKELTQYTKDKREQNPNLSSRTVSTFSNQIETGEMIDSLEVIKNKKEYSIEVTSPSRKAVVGKQEEMGRVFLALSEDDKKYIDNEIDSIVEEALGDMFEE